MKIDRRKYNGKGNTPTKNKYYYFLFCNDHDKHIDPEGLDEDIVLYTCLLFESYIKSHKLTDWKILLNEMVKSINLIELKLIDEMEYSDDIEDEDIEYVMNNVKFIQLC